MSGFFLLFRNFLNNKESENRVTRKKESRYFVRDGTNNELLGQKHGHSSLAKRLSYDHEEIEWRNRFDTMVHTNPRRKSVDGREKPYEQSEDKEQGITSLG